ncbi:MAG: hypothetical protein IJ206_06255 [Oscillospiraceae bacterium]|nr:hypothetical protein [Oscillospiraceae bacterium]
MVSILILTESAVLSFFGAVAGLALGALILLPFSGLISATLGMPYLLPGLGGILGIGAGSLLISVLSGSLTAAISAWRVGKIDAGQLLREGT